MGEKENALTTCKDDMENIKKKIELFLVGKDQRDIQIKQQERKNAKLEEQVNDLQKSKSSIQLEVYTLKKKLSESEKDHYKEMNKVTTMSKDIEKEKIAAEDQRDQYCKVLTSLRSTLDQEKILTSKLAKKSWRKGV